MSNHISRRIRRSTRRGLVVVVAAALLAPRMVACRPRRPSGGPWPMSPLAAARSRTAPRRFPERRTTRSPVTSWRRGYYQRAVVEAVGE